MKSVRIAVCRKMRMAENFAQSTGVIRAMSIITIRIRQVSQESPNERCKREGRCYISFSKYGRDFVQFRHGDQVSNVLGCVRSSPFRHSAHPGGSHRHQPSPYVSDALCLRPNSPHRQMKGRVRVR